LTPLDLTEANDLLSTWLLSGEPFLAGRYGLTEASVCWWKGMRGKVLGKPIRSQLTWGVGVYPTTPAMIDELISHQMWAASHADGIVRWGSGKVHGEDLLLEHTTKDDVAFLPPEVNFAFLQLERPWTQHLAGKRVLVVHPFVTTIMEQYWEKREKLFDNPSILPELDNLTVMDGIQSIGGTGPHNNWVESLDIMSDAIRILVRDDVFDVALIACGGYGFPLAARCKLAGKPAIHLGGALQLLFGIKGRRFDKNPVVTPFYNDHWVRPRESERPKGWENVENGCYW